LWAQSRPSSTAMATTSPLIVPGILKVREGEGGRGKGARPVLGRRPWTPRPPYHRREIPTRCHPLLPRSLRCPRQGSLSSIRLNLTPFFCSKFAQCFLPDGYHPLDTSSLLPLSSPRRPSSDGQTSIPPQPMSLTAGQGVELHLPHSRPPATATPSPLVGPVDSTRGGSAWWPGVDFVYPCQ
jgi:hypothetical protein